MVVITNTRTKSQQIHKMYSETMEEEAYEESEIVQEDMGDEYYVEVEEHYVVNDHRAEGNA